MYWAAPPRPACIILSQYLTPSGRVTDNVIINDTQNIISIQYVPRENEYRHENTLRLSSLWSNLLGLNHFIIVTWFLMLSICSPIQYVSWWGQTFKHASYLIIYHPGCGPWAGEMRRETGRLKFLSHWYFNFIMTCQYTAKTQSNTWFILYWGGLFISCSCRIPVPYLACIMLQRSRRTA